MAKRVFFSFHYQDVIDFRANVVRNHWVTKEHRDAAGFYDASIWEKAKKEGDIAIKRLINQGLENTSNTCVLIGTETHSRPWVRYEILKSLKRGNHIFGVHINSIKCKKGIMKSLAKNPLDSVGVYAEDNSSYSLIEHNGKEWIYYKSIDGTEKVNVKHSLVLKKILPLSHFFNVYDWDKGDGYNNFADWVK
ncbi:MAG: TIR domain-containing protein [Sulfuricurvum sp.]|jgi:hypothetical protein|uniref:TIR domain-containing protein n=1 Tax=Sulfuricurvum sp. TaxID=2025608 RepID=UPI0025D35577|nr:TIR domain-containing protein [Sulfuricurvum sp.]MCK9373556.1 TIR domain-containing protein [Sulfuricurvum sp.]